MKKKIIAAGIAALLAGASLPLLGANVNAASSSLSDYIRVSDGKLVSPVMVVGSKAHTLDVVSASDVSGTIGSLAISQVPVPGATITRITDGASLLTSSRPLFVGSKLNSAREILTSSSLPEILASGAVTDDSGKPYYYEQFIVLGDSVFEFSDSNGDIDNPEVLLQMGTDQNSPAFSFRIDFGQALPFNDPDVRGSEITMFGKWFAIDPTSTNSKIVLNGGGKKLLLHEDQESSITFEGQTYNVRLVGISDSRTAVIQVNGATKSVIEGESKKIGDISVYVDDVFYLPKQTRISSANIIIGTNKLVLENGKAVKSGINENSIKNTKVSITSSSSGVKQVRIAVTPQSSSSDHLVSGSTWTDTVFGSVRLAFAGINPPLNDDSRTEIRVEPSGSSEASLKMTDWYGKTKSFKFAYDSDRSDTSNQIMLKNNAGKDAIVVVEGQPVEEGDYFITSIGTADLLDYSHLFRLSSISGLGTSSSKITLTDVFSQESITVNLGSDDRAMKTIDGVDYFFEATDYNGDEKVMVTWGDGDSSVTFGDPGKHTIIYPLLKEKNGARIVITGLARTQAIGFQGAETGDRFKLPTGYLRINDYDLSDMSVTLEPINLRGVSGNSVTVTDDSSKTISVGKVKYTVSYIEDSDGNYLEFSLSEAGSSPAIMVLEERNYNYEFEAVIVPVGQNSDGITIKVPKFTDNVGKLVSTTSRNIKHGVDKWGSFVEYKSGNKGNVKVLYPGTQAVVTAAIGKDPQFITSSGGGSVNVPIKITEPFTKLDTEINKNSIG